jgi:hypothetical protein
VTTGGLDGGAVAMGALRCGWAANGVRLVNADIG